MAESIIHSDRVRDLTAASRRTRIEVEGSVTCEIPLTLWATFCLKETNTAQDLGGAGWLANLREKTREELANEIVVLGGPSCGGWQAISSFLLSAPHRHDPDRAFEWLSTVEDNRLRRWLIGYSAHNQDQALIERAAEGDLDAAAELIGDRAESKPELLDHLKWMIHTDDLPVRYADALEAFRAEVFSGFEEEFAAAISRAAAAQRNAPSGRSAREVVEEVTSGIDFDIPQDTGRVVIVPSMLTRPLSLIDQYRGTLFVYYGVPDEFVDIDPQAPPPWLVRTYKALGDERRLRILRRLGEGPASLDELTEMLDLSKSTVHHHTALLRGAGLIRIHIPEDKSSAKKSFSLREQSLAAARGFLDSYLTTAEEKESVH